MLANKLAGNKLMHANGISHHYEHTPTRDSSVSPFQWLPPLGGVCVLCLGVFNVVAAEEEKVQKDVSHKKMMSGCV